MLRPGAAGRLVQIEGGEVALQRRKSGDEVRVCVYCELPACQETEGIFDHGLAELIPDY